KSQVAVAPAPVRHEELPKVGVEVPVSAKTTGAPPSPSVKDRVLALVSQKTGYPVDMLDLDLDLEADLGVDTVKQAEVFATIGEAYGIARDDKIKLRDFPTLAHVIRFVYDRRPDLAETTKLAPMPVTKFEPALAQETEPVLSVKAETTPPSIPIETSAEDL